MTSWPSSPGFWPYLASLLTIPMTTLFNCQTSGLSTLTWLTGSARSEALASDLDGRVGVVTVETLDGELSRSIASASEVVEGTTNDTVVVSSGELFLPEACRIEGFLDEKLIVVLDDGTCEYLALKNG
ncbi:hypothetical protein BKA70DRAFT_1256004 [Coprinopsis sp. MPI-PUGE-AT-0042]|nr:hypothetical protein BKA70DRAFT_1256004 [Coprinopsis sp. MPI-PUGE-AT-0042]